MSEKNSKKSIFNLKTALRGGPKGGPMGARPAARRAHNRPPWGTSIPNFNVLARIVSEI